MSTLKNQIEYLLPSYDCNSVDQIDGSMQPGLVIATQKEWIKRIHD